jgi:hypothetical protein
MAKATSHKITNGLAKRRDALARRVRRLGVDSAILLTLPLSRVDATAKDAVGAYCVLDADYLPTGLGPVPSVAFRFVRGRRLRLGFHEPVEERADISLRRPVVAAKTHRASRFPTIPSVCSPSSALAQLHPTRLE